MAELYIGLMSGTSADGIDAVLVDFDQPYPALLGKHYTPYPPCLRQKILSLCEQGDNEIHRLGELDVLLGKAFADATNSLLRQYSVSPLSVKAIGSHGQTIRHCPWQPHRFTLQIGDPNTIAAETGITTVADFRRKDLAFGGQGAPLVPAFHQYAFSSEDTCRAIVNIGGIANVTFLPPKTQAPVIGFDTGPGNVLMDAWIWKYLEKSYDSEGAWGKEGTIQPGLLKNLLADSYFRLSPPKSTGREYFNLAWLEKYLRGIEADIKPVDVQATLAELTALSIMTTISHTMTSGEILVCGGGAHNTSLMERLQKLGSSAFLVDSTSQYGIDPDWVEAVAFAWLAKQTLHHCTGNLPSVTGARQGSILGGIYFQ